MQLYTTQLYYEKICVHIQTIRKDICLHIIQNIGHSPVKQQMQLGSNQ